VNLSYNISEHLNGYLTKLESLRSNILLAPISPKNELRLRWDAILERTIWTLSLTDNPLSKTEVVNLLASSTLSPKRKLTNDQKDVLSLKNSFSYLKENWLVSKNPVTLTVIKKLYDVSCRNTLGKMSGLTEYSEKRINTLLEYLNKGADPPFIQAGIVQAEIVNITPFDSGNLRIARLLSYLFLYKNGYDVRGLVNLEEFYKRDMVTYKRMLDMAKIQGNMTVWLEYFTFCASAALEKAFDVIQNLKFQEELPATYWKLNSRQKRILEILENPNDNITNKEVQKIFGISQITASRDLSHLTSLELLLTHGKGRSVYYTRV
jgi:Fic family protein